MSCRRGQLQESTGSDVGTLLVSHELRQPASPDATHPSQEHNERGHSHGWRSRRGQGTHQGSRRRPDGDKDLQNEGKADKAGGKVKDAVDSVKDKLTGKD